MIKKNIIPGPKSKSQLVIDWGFKLKLPDRWLLPDTLIRVSFPASEKAQVEAMVSRIGETVL